MAATESQEQTIVSLLQKAHGTVLGAAFGDAVGWPQERRARRVDNQRRLRTPHPDRLLMPWVRRISGQFNSFSEHVLEGEYSDDTQLTLCTARSLLANSPWWQYFSHVALPMWTLYERGGGIATLRAANLWLGRRNGPWSPNSKLDDRRNYFDAGGNGVAMRIAPHCLRGARSSSFASVAREIVANGVTTHGHPRSLVGALAYGYALWLGIRHTETLAYGELIDRLLSDTQEWSPLPDIEEMWPGWREAAEIGHSGQYQELWRTTVQEMVDRLTLCRDAIGNGALAVDQKLLAQIGCFHTTESGSGLVAAAAAVFLASRYAADPMHGVLEAAFAEGADTDTIASMAGGLLGAISGPDWLGSNDGRVQDASYLGSIAERLVEHVLDALATSSSPLTPVTSAHVDAVRKDVARGHSGSVIRLPDGRDAVMSDPVLLPSASRTRETFRWKLVTTDGETLYIRRLARKSVQQHSPTSSDIVDSTTQPDRGLVTEVITTTIGLQVRDMKRAREFYEGILGLKVIESSSTRLRYEGGIILVAAPDESGKGLAPDSSMHSDGATIIGIQTRSVDQIYGRVQRGGIVVIEPLETKSHWRSFRCLDPDGHSIQIYQDVREQTDQAASQNTSPVQAQPQEVATPVQTMALPLK